MTAYTHRWEPIADLSDADLKASSEELPPLAEVWREEHGALAGDQALADFNARLQREWAIETGIIERLYTLDRGITQLLIEQGIDASLIPNGSTDKAPELVAAIIQDQQAAVEWLFDIVASRRALSTSFVRELHSLITRHQDTATAVDQFGNEVNVPLLRGEYKQWPNNPVRPDGQVHEYCPPEQVAPEMERLIQLHAEHLDRAVPPEVESAWLHHRFTQIHPFQDGNGRIARALGTLVLIQAGWFPLVVTRSDRARYIDALEIADRGDLEPLVALFAGLQKKAFVGALGIAREVQQEGEHVDQVIEVIGEMFSDRDADLRRELSLAKDTAETVWSAAAERFDEVARELDKAIAAVNPARKVFADAASPRDERRNWHRWQVVETAHDLGYFAGLREFSCWVRLCLETETGRSEILLSLHSIGREYRGLIGASLTFYRRQETADAERQVVDRQTVCDEIFQINYRESSSAVATRFSHWLEQGLVRALETWRQGE